ncbi:rhomboid family intramembrane serine protease [Aeromicrobium sp.]|uniref:rhomboid family intramembrane serine protease n=1 Tax=Aeromicrobium sp. TaxID=1871063 RepID=UPI0019BE361F|nr:rhomboid family intramembrane serine protease [Aeromicrobium sp.]MBC7631733.1 rhomboid family intramembrane serine protease [Aeromicrobium sp.]
MSTQGTKSRLMSVPARAGALAGGFVAVLYVIEMIDTTLSGRLDRYGVHPRSVGGIDGIVFAPLLHGGWGHLIANTVPLLVLGFLVALSGARTWVRVTAIVWVVGGAGVWLFAGSGTNHIGASGVVFGWLAYLIVRGIFTRSLRQIALGVVVLLTYGGVLWGVLPGRPGVSWQGHLFGAVAGALAAWLLARRHGSRR